MAKEKKIQQPPESCNGQFSGTSNKDTFEREYSIDQSEPRIDKSVSNSSYREPSFVTDSSFSRGTRDETMETRLDFFEQHPSQMKRVTATLTLLSGPEKGKVFDIPESKQMVVGRSRDANIHIKELSVSRKHLTITSDDTGRVFVTDLNSSNGTYVNDIRVDKVVLSNNDKIKIGEDIYLKFSLVDDIDKQYMHNLYESATKDFLTKALKKDAFLNKFKAELENTKNAISTIALVMLDIDFFKKVNDTHGHTVGDYVLAELVQLFQKRLRRGNVLGRYGGEEFILFLKDTTPEGALTYANKMIDAVREHPFEYESIRVPIRISMGISICDVINCNDARDTTVEEMIKEADQYLYKAKQKGRDRVECALTADEEDERTSAKF